MPSIGSTTQRTPLVPSRAAPSSPSTPSSGRAPSSRPTISSSLALSTAVTTSTGLDLTSTCVGRPWRGRAPTSSAASSGGGDGELEQLGGRSRGRVGRAVTGAILPQPARRTGRGLTTLSACRASEWTSAAAASRDAWSTSRRASSSGSGCGSRRRSPSLPDPVYGVVGARSSAPFDWTGRIGVTFPGVMKHGVAYTAANVDKSWIGTDVDAGLAKLHPRHRGTRSTTPTPPGSPRCATAPAATSAASS